MKVVSLQRVFLYNGLELADPDPSRSPAQVKDFYSAMYPELATAEVEGPDTKDRLEYKFKRSAGVKGRSASKEEAVPFAQRLAALAQGQPDPMSARERQVASPGPKLAAQIARFHELANLHGEHQLVPSSAIALML